MPQSRVPKPDGRAPRRSIAKKERAALDSSTQGQHVGQAAYACRPDQDSKDKSQSYRQFSVSDQKRNWLRERKNKTLENRYHKWVGAIRQKSIDPKLKAASQCELSAKNLVFAENGKQDSNSDAESCEGPGT